MWWVGCDILRSDGKKNVVCFKGGKICDVVCLEGG